MRALGLMGCSASGRASRWRRTLWWVHGRGACTFSLRQTGVRRYPAYGGTASCPRFWHDKCTLCEGWVRGALCSLLLSYLRRLQSCWGVIILIRIPPTAVPSRRPLAVVQTRGSVPLLWSAPPDLSLNPRPRAAAMPDGAAPRQEPQQAEAARNVAAEGAQGGLGAPGIGSSDEEVQRRPFAAHVKGLEAAYGKVGCGRTGRRAVQVLRCTAAQAAAQQCSGQDPLPGSHKLHVWFVDGVRCQHRVMRLAPWPEMPVPQ